MPNWISGWAGTPHRTLRFPSPGKTSCRTSILKRAFPDPHRNRPLAAFTVKWHADSDPIHIPASVPVGTILGALLGSRIAFVGANNGSEGISDQSGLPVQF